MSVPPVGSRSSMSEDGNSFRYLTSYAGRGRLASAAPAGGSPGVDRALLGGSAGGAGEMGEQTDDPLPGLGRVDHVVVRVGVADRGEAVVVAQLDGRPRHRHDRHAAGV